MSILITAMALAAAPPPAAAVQPAAAPESHAHDAHDAKPGAKPQHDGCSCCKDMAAAGKMECCAKHGKGHGEHGAHSGPDAAH